MKIFKVSMCLFISMALISGCSSVGKMAEIDVEKGENSLRRYINQVNLETLPLVEDENYDSTEVLMPDIEKSYPLVVNSQNATVMLEVFSSPEKSGSGYEAWLTNLVKDFNEEHYGKYGINLRNISSGVAYDYISSGTYAPHLFSPSNDMWVRMLEDDGFVIETISESLASNTAGVAISNEKVKELGISSISSVIEGVNQNKLKFGYTNPHSSSAGLNLLQHMLNLYDNTDPFSDLATEKFITFQSKVAHTAVNTMSLRNLAQSGKLDAFVFEQQTFVNTPELVKEYKFIPFGEPHNQPLVVVSNLTQEQYTLAELFNSYCLKSAAQSSARDAGFNIDKDYSYTENIMTGAQLKYAQSFWRTNKTGSKEMNVVFVVDTSGSMDGLPMQQMKKALLTASSEIGEETSVGLITYSGSVCSALPIAKFDEQQTKYFNGAIKRMDASGATSTYSAVIVALDMLQKYKETATNSKSIVVLLTDGEANAGIAASKALYDTVYNVQIPVYCVAYNYSGDASLEQLINSCEAELIKANDGDAIYRLVSLFKAIL